MYFLDHLKLGACTYIVDLNIFFRSLKIGFMHVYIRVEYILDHLRLCSCTCIVRLEIIFQITKDRVHACL